ncbi:putative leader peptide [Streptomyces sp. DK15]|uniref:putative leader peptide n=1 Tax=Streptomyces sp. DK15 TaxID=2957499 RepID=UPI0029C0F39C|nr:putative leader peptide [Streptomyces sp. DK15]
MSPSQPLLVRRRHVDLRRVASAVCRPAQGLSTGHFPDACRPAGCRSSPRARCSRDPGPLSRTGFHPACGAPALPPHP